LKDRGEITTRSFGLYIGTAYPRAGGAINGSLTLGGYDSGRLEGNSTTFSVASDFDVRAGETPFRVRVESVTLFDGNSNNESIPLTTAPYDAFITTDQFGMTLPPSVTDTFVERTSATAEDNEFSEQTFALPADSNYTMTVTLANNLTITIPANEMRNASNASPITSTPANLTTPLLGSHFLSKVYLTVNYDASPPAFYLAQASPHGPYVLPEPICSSTVPAQAEPVNISSWKRNGIIGAVLGGVIGGIGLTFAIWWCWSKARQQKLSKLAEGEDEEAKAGLAIKDGISRRFGAIFSPFDRRRKGKGRSADYQPADTYHAKKPSWSSISDQNESDFAMQQFEPVPIPSAYNHANGSGALTLVDAAVTTPPFDKQHIVDPEQPREPGHFPEAPPTLVIGAAISSPDDIHPALRDISPVSPISAYFDSSTATYPADFPLPASPPQSSPMSSRRDATSVTPTPIAGAAALGLVLPPLLNAHGVRPTSLRGEIVQDGDGLRTPGADSLGDEDREVTLTASLRTDTNGSSDDLAGEDTGWAAPVRRSKTLLPAFTGQARTAQKVKVVPINVRGGSLKGKSGR
jgi:hypothetical protein